MFNHFKLRFEMAKLCRSKKRNLDACHRALQEAQAKHESREQIAAVTSEYRFEYDMIEDEINLTISDFWIAKAQKLFLPIPSTEDRTMWTETNNNPDRRVLTSKGVVEVRPLVRAERKAQMDTWLPWLTALTGLVGALIGLLAFLKK